MDFEQDQFRTRTEVGHVTGIQDPEMDVTDDDLLVTGTTALAHQSGFSDGCDSLEKMEEAKR